LALGCATAKPAKISTSPIDPANALFFAIPFDGAIFSPKVRHLLRWGRYEFKLPCQSPMTSTLLTGAARL
jgi:hypothetical protein